MAVPGFKKKHVRRGSMPSFSSLVRNLSSGTLASQASRAEALEEDPAPSLIQEVAASGNKDWNTVQRLFLKLFQDRSPPEFSLINLTDIVRKLSEGQIGPFLYDYYREQMLPKAMQALKEGFDEVSLLSLLETWDYFYMEILPRLQVIFHPVQVKDLTIKQASLVAFRDHVLLQSQVTVLLESLDPEQTDVPPSLEQMLLVLASARDHVDGKPPNAEYLQLERLVAILIQPYLGYRGLYMAGPEPVVFSAAEQLNQGYMMRNRTWSGDSGDMEIRGILRQTSHTKSGTGITLEPLREHIAYDGSRRHSVTFT